MTTSAKANTKATSQPQSDQAAGLRSLMARQGPRLIVVCEDRDHPATRRGVASSLAGALGRQRQAVLLLDESRPERLRRWLPDPAEGGGPAVLPLAELPATLGELLKAQDGQRLNVVLIDAMANADGGLSPLASQAQDALVVLPGNDESGAALTSAYATIKQLHQRHAGILFRVIVTDCAVESRAYGVFCRLATVASRYLTVRLSFVGHLPPAAQSSDPALMRAFDRVAANLPLWSR